MRYARIVILILVIKITALGQNINPDAGYIFDDSFVPKIEIFIAQDSLDELLDSDNWELDHEYPVTMIYSKWLEKDTIDNVGFRLRGNTSRKAEKKSFKIAINAFEKGKKFYGLEKINLNGEHNDPSIMRSKLCFDIFNDVGIPSSRSVHTTLYINGEYKGLYIHVEHIDEEFIQKRFDDDSGNLYKCLYPTDFDYKGSNPALYTSLTPWGTRPYDLKTNLEEYDYSDLAHFIDVLNNYSGENFRCEIERIFDVDSYLKVIAIDILTGNWDGPIVNKNNCYLYHDPKTDRMIYIPFDLDNTLGVDFFNVNWAQSSIYSWSSISNESRPIYERFMDDYEYRSRFSFYMKQILKEHFNPDDLGSKIGSLKSFIAQYRASDTYAGADYGWFYEDFLASFDEGLGGHANIGLRSYISERHYSATAQLETSNMKPFIVDENVSWGPDVIIFEIAATDDVEVTGMKFHYSLNGGEWSEDVVTLDNNWSGTYEYQVSQPGVLSYYFELSDDTGLTSFYPRCQDGSVSLGYTAVPELVINEILTSNSNGIQDDFEEYEDWIELYNPSDEAINLGNLYLSDDIDEPNKWNLPNVDLNPDAYLLIWADDDNGQGDLHTNFKLSKSGEFLGLFDGSNNNFAPIDTFTFPEQEEDRSYARIPNGVGDFEISNINTPYGNNDESVSTVEITSEMIIYPNPVGETLFLSNILSKDNIDVIDVNGNAFSVSISGNQVNVQSLHPGIYLLKYMNEERFEVVKFVKM